MSEKKIATAVHYEPKMMHYDSDGTGRDTYVKFSNGGIWKDRQILTSGPSISTFAPPRKWISPHPQMVPKFQHYPPDGTGRDSYVIQDEGGLAPTSTKFKQKSNFLTSLRQYKKQQSASLPKIPDYFSIAQTPMAQSIKNYNLNLEKSVSQKNLIERLNYTKNVGDPYSKMRKLTLPCYKDILKRKQQ